MTQDIGPAPHTDDSRECKQLVAIRPDPEARSRLRAYAYWFDWAKRLELGPEAYANYVFKS